MANVCLVNILAVFLAINSNRLQNHCSGQIDVSNLRQKVWRHDRLPWLFTTAAPCFTRCFYANIMGTNCYQAGGCICQTTKCLPGSKPMLKANVSTVRPALCWPVIVSAEEEKNRVEQCGLWIELPVFAPAERFITPCRLRTSGGSSEFLAVAVAVA